MQTQTGRQTERQTYRQIEIQTEPETERHRQTDRQTDKKTDRQTNMPTEKQRIREKEKFPGVTTHKTWQVNFYYHIQFEERASCSFSAQ